MAVKDLFRQTGLWVEKAAYSALDMTGFLEKLGKLMHQAPTVLSFHSVQPPFSFGNSWFKVSHPSSEFGKIIEFLGAHYEIVPLSRVVAHIEGKSPGKPREIALTFDDGYEDNLLHVWPILAERRLPWTVFVTVGAVEEESALWTVHVADALDKAPHRLISLDLVERGGRRRRFVLDMRDDKGRKRAKNQVSGFLVTLPWSSVQQNVNLLDCALGHKTVSQGAKRLRLLTWEQCRELSRSGVDVGSHGMYHLAMECQDDVSLWTEICGSKELLERRIGAPVRHFCYPFGTPGFFGPRSRAMCKMAGYNAAFLNIRGLVVKGGENYEIPRLSCPIGELLRLRGRLAGFANRIRLPIISSDIRPGQ